MKAEERQDIEDKGEGLSKKARKKPSPKAQEEPVSQPDRGERARTFLTELQKEPPANMQEEPISEPGRMQKARAFREVLQDKKAEEESSSRLHVDIAGAMRKMLKDSSSGSTPQEPGTLTSLIATQEPIDVRNELYQEQQEIHRQYHRAAEFTQTILHNIEDGKPIRPEDVESEISELANKLLLGSQEILLLSTSAAEDYAKDYLASSMVNVTVIAMKVAMSLGYNKSKLVQLGSCAFLANVGMVKLLPVVATPARLKSNEYKEVKKHTLYGAEILETLGFPENYVKVALQHHERKDGSGYPNGLKGNEIHEFARIVGLSEVVESMSHHRAHRSFIPIHEVVRNVVENWRPLFSSTVVRALVKALGIFPVGTEVILSSGETAKIIRNNPDSSLRPIVQVFGKLEDDNMVDHPKIINLMEKPFIYIKGPSRGKVS